MISWAGILGAFNLALNLGVSRPVLSSFISVNPETLSFDYRRAWSFWPPLVYVRNVRVRGSDANVQWQVEVDEARLSIALPALFKREFHVTKLRANGIAFRLRQKLPVGAATDDRVAALPPILGFDRRPLLEAGPPERDIPDDQYDLWAVRIENVAGSARQVWVDEFRLEGDARVTGGFFLQPRRRLSVGPAHADVLLGVVLIGKQKLLTETVGAVDCTIPPIDPRPPVGREMFRFVSGAFRLDANIPNIRALDYYPRIRGSTAKFDGGEGRFHIDGALHSGVARPLDLSLNLHRMRAETPEWLALGSVQVSGKAEAKGPNAWLVHITPLELRRARAKTAAVQGKELIIEASSDQIDISKPTPTMEVQAHLPSGEVPDLRFINTFTGQASPLQVDRGRPRSLPISRPTRAPRAPRAIWRSPLKKRPLTMGSSRSRAGSMSRLTFRMRSSTLGTSTFPVRQSMRETSPCEIRKRLSPNGGAMSRLTLQRSDRRNECLWK